MKTAAVIDSGEKMPLGLESGMTELQSVVTADTERTDSATAGGKLCASASRVRVPLRRPEGTAAARRGPRRAHGHEADRRMAIPGGAKLTIPDLCGPDDDTSPCITVMLPDEDRAEGGTEEAPAHPISRFSPVRRGRRRNRLTITATTSRPAER